MKILHVLANSFPKINGYAVRSHMLIKAQAEIDDLENLAVTSPWYPNIPGLDEDYEQDGVKYYRTNHPLNKKNTKISHKLVAKLSSKNKRIQQEKPFLTRAILFVIKKTLFFPHICWKVIEERILIEHFYRRILQISIENDVDVIHAHTPYRVGLPAYQAAKKIGIPFVYEMRGMWEETAVANGRWISGGPAYWRFRKKETKLMKKADSLVCISEALKIEAISRGISKHKITVSPNGYDAELQSGQNESEMYKAVKSDLNIGKSTKVIGYIGSLRKLEGVDYTAKAVAKLCDLGYDVRFFTLSSESGQNELRNLCKDLGIYDRSTIVGPVDHNEVSPYFGLIDLFVVSRPMSRVTNIVTPLKPFEAMGLGRTVICSNLTAMKEIIEHKKTGLLYDADDLDSLVHQIKWCLDNPEQAKSLGQASKAWISENRTWVKIAEHSKSAYLIM